MEKYDLIVIGAGPGGYVAAIQGAHLGKKVACIENRDCGGTCLNRGCIPTKALLHTAELYEEMKNCEAVGLKADNISYDFKKMHERKSEVVMQLRSGVESLFKSNGIDLIRGTGQIVDANTVKVGEETFETEHILIATGSVPTLPKAPGLDLPGVVTSDDLLEGDGVDTKSICIVGGGVIGVEFASVYAALGAEVTIMVTRDRMLFNLDKEVAQNLGMIFKKQGVKILTKARFDGVEKGENGLIVNYSNTQTEEKGTLACETVLVCKGRRAYTDGLIPEGMDLQLERGKIPVDENFETCIKGIYAIGDVIKGNMMLAHEASAQGINCVCGMFGAPAPKDVSVIPSGIYTNPEIACVGMTEAEAKDAGRQVIIGKNITTGNGKHIISMSPRGFVKLVFDAETKELIGATLMCQRATDMLGVMTDAVVNKLTLEDMGKAVWAHPTFSEVIGEAIEDAEGGSIHTAPKKRR